ncbi:hypothetical protein BV22DRAFT_595659 [Leucogyrophana mollusca]|uniref:Uncharacterized protein n=1 Tax=Leucogyrophana mollusca TaxID=85980 RepID=A0ACB8BBU5_9AGAM|nr:hypothetical protein BV22DRAFT_595659 [Leucogyrophana mollusca]
MCPHRCFACGVFSFRVWRTSPAAGSKSRLGRLGRAGCAHRWRAPGGVRRGSLESDFVRSARGEGGCGILRGAGARGGGAGGDKAAKLARQSMSRPGREPRQRILHCQLHTRHNVILHHHIQLPIAASPHPPESDLVRRSSKLDWHTQAVRSRLSHLEKLTLAAAFSLDVSDLISSRARNWLREKKGS